MGVKNDSKIKQIKIYPTGYFLYYRINGKRRLFKIADKAVLINVVRKTAIKYLNQIHEGIDPMNKERTQTFGEAFGIYLNKLKANEAKSVDRVEKTYKNNIEAAIGNKNINEITSNDIAVLHGNISKRAPVLANRCLQYIKATYNTLMIEPNPASKIKLNRETERKVYLTDDQLVAVVRELNKKSQDSRNAKSVAFIWLLILTGARKSEIGNAKWKDFDGTKLIIQNHKTDRLGEPRIIYLPPQAIRIINELDKTDEYIIGIKDPKALWNSVRKNANCPGLHLHDLRHSFASWSRKYMKLDAVGNLLGHVDIASTKRYAHIFEEESVENVQKVGEHIQNIIMRASG